MRGYIYNYCSRMEWMREDRATMWVRMPDFKAPFTALALVLAEHLVEELEARATAVETHRADARHPVIP